jgi:hypothetical protein
MMSRRTLSPFAVAAIATFIFVESSSDICLEFFPAPLQRLIHHWTQESRV